MLTDIVTKWQRRYCLLYFSNMQAVFSAPVYPISTGDKQPKKQEKKPVSVSPEFVDEALCACEEHLNNLAHMDIDKDVETPPCLSPEGWSLFLQRYYQVVQ